MAYRKRLEAKLRRVERRHEKALRGYLGLGTERRRQKAFRLAMKVDEVTKTLRLVSIGLSKKEISAIPEPMMYKYLYRTDLK